MKRGSAQNPGCKAQIAVATDYEPPGRRQIRHPRLVCGPFGVAGCGKIGPSLTCREGALQGRDEEGRARRARGDTRRAPATLPGGADWLGARAGRKGQGRGEPAGSDGGRTGRCGASRDRGRWDPGGCGALTRCGSSSGFAGGGDSSGGNSSSSASSTAPPSLRRLLRLRSPPPPTTTFGDVTPVT